MLTVYKIKKFRTLPNFDLILQYVNRQKLFRANKSRVATMDNLKHIFNRKFFFFCLILAAGGLLFFLFFRNGDEIAYITEQVKRQNVEKVVNATGEVRAIELVTVGAQVSGKIEKLYVSIGQEVKKGDMIAEIDSTTQQNDVDINKAKLDSYKAQLQAAQVSLKIAEKQYKRMQTLKKRNAASAEDLENAEDTYETAKSKVTELESTIKETEISLSTAETNLGYTKITAPLDGTIVSIPVKQGQTINAAMDTPAIVQIADLTRMEILIEISEGDISNIKPGVKVTYSILADLNDVFETTLQSIDPGLTLLTNNEYTEVVDSSEAIYYYGRLIVPNDDGKLRIGMTTQNVIFVENAENVLTIPVTAVKNNGSQKYVEILTDKGVQQRTIVTGVSDGLNIEVKEGVSEGDEIILAHMSSAEISDKLSNMRGPRGF